MPVASLYNSYHISLKRTRKIPALTIKMFSPALAREPSVLKIDSNITTKDVGYPRLIEPTANEHEILYSGDSSASN